MPACKLPPLTDDQHYAMRNKWYMSTRAILHLARMLTPYDMIPAACYQCNPVQLPMQKRGSTDCAQRAAMRVAHACSKRAHDPAPQGITTTPNTLSAVN